MSVTLIIYLSIFGVGFVFLVVSFLSGLDHDVDVDHEIDHPGELSADTMSPSYFSMKVISCFLMGVGLGATASRIWITGPEPLMWKYAVDLAIGLIGGFIEGYLGWKIIKLLLSQQGNTTYTVESFVGKRCQVTAGVVANGTGEISATINGVLRSLDVKSESGQEIKVGTQVEVLSISGSIGIVRPVSSTTAEK